MNLTANGLIKLGDLKVTIQLAAFPGSILWVDGVSGCGKTSLLRWIAGLFPGINPGQGSLTLGELNLLELPVERRRISYLFQNPILFPHLSVMDNLLLPFRNRHNATPAQLVALIKSQFQILGAEELLARSVMQLSGGETQRIALVRALMVPHDLLLLDEPMTALDETNRNKMIQFIVDELKRRPRPCLWVSHQGDERAQLETKIELKTVRCEQVTPGLDHRFISTV